MARRSPITRRRLAMRGASFSAMAATISSGAGSSFLTRWSAAPATTRFASRMLSLPWQPAPTSTAAAAPEKPTRWKSAATASDFFGVANFETITNITALRFVDTDPPGRSEHFRSGIGGRVRGQIRSASALYPRRWQSTALRPLRLIRSTFILVFADFDPDDTTPVNLNLSGWTFANWNQESTRVDIETNEAVALNDSSSAAWSAT